MPERMDQLPELLQVKKLFDSLDPQAQKYAEEWVQPRFRSLLDTLDAKSGPAMMRIFDTEIVPRLRDQGLLRGWRRPQ